MTIFVVIYVYDQGSDPTWYSATLEWTGGGANFAWSGDLYATKGPWFGTIPFNPAQVTLRKVGTATWVAQTVSSGLLTYSVDGVQIAKNLYRYLLHYDDFQGHYAGGVHRTSAACANPALNATTEFPALVNIVQNGQTMSVQTVGPGTASCNYTGTLSQAGQMGRIIGNFACTTGESGTFDFFEMQVNISGITARLAFRYAVPQGCTATGWFGGARGTTF